MIEFIKCIALKLRDITLLKLLVATLIAVFLPHTKAIIILCSLIGIDTILGTWYAIINGIFSSSGMKKTATKIILYTLAVFSVKMIQSLVGPSAIVLVSIIFTYLSLIELSSIFENLIRLGLPINADMIQTIFNKIPYGKSFAKDFNFADPEIKNQGDIIKGFLVVVNKKPLTRLMRIFWLNWRKFSEHIINFSDDIADVEYLVSDLKLELQMTKRSISNKLGDGTVGSKIVDLFDEVNTENVESLELSLKSICKAEESMVSKKKQMLREVTKYIQTTLQDVLSKV